MRTHINVPVRPVGTYAKVRAIVRGGLALHVALRNDGRVLNEWSVTHVETGKQIIVMRGPRAGRVAFRLLSGVPFDTIDEKLLRRCNKVVTQLRKRGLTVLFPHKRFVAIKEEA